MHDYDFGGLTDLLNRIETLAYDPATAGAATELTAAMLTVLGSGPSIAAIDEIIATNDANGIIYANAQHQQQMTNIIGMVAMAKCVQVMLENSQAQLDPDMLPGVH